MKQYTRMTGSNLLDTNIVIELFKGNPTITSFLETLKEEINIPFAVLGELYLGAYRSTNPKKHIKQINSFLERCNVLNADNETANHYALIKTALLQKGKPIPENDMWIAAISKQFDLNLHTKDKHFKEIYDLNLQSW
ncbi:type II toxin-antitoxin system VapC family toxin [Pedobacter sp. CFBP9032]|uniref:type II toxin-antitoxin system VapC family toxin n=1 Tax=Pedobacter sp. CFBP9032 TaxID=3096539 RepID=UPI002A6B644D|nr:type II toxin-antitoxin system VapC family toxin [Pedobacter sp. CFBP9032]MDY0906299.1 type II toxin-antitoxin system VapC family toxin [Pedobacter sp. CFBP9032]